jgi:ABC-type transport system substrate-binding protein
MLTRRGFLATGAGAAPIAARPSPALAQTPKRGGTLTIHAWDPPHFDASLVHAYKTRVAISFTHSRLLRHRAGAGVKPGSLMIEGDLAESWTQPSDTTYVFKLRRGVRFHAKPPVNGRELTAEDVKFTFERMLTEACRNASMYRAIAKVEAVDRYTVRFTLSEPFAWFLDMVASPMAGGIVARECVEKWGDLKKPEAVIGTGPWMLECYRPNVSLTMVRHPGYFVPGLGRAADRRGHACAVRLKPDYSAAQARPGARAGGPHGRGGRRVCHGPRGGGPHRGSADQEGDRGLPAAPDQGGRVRRTGRGALQRLDIGIG